MDNNLKTKMTILRIDIKKKVLKISRLEREISIIHQAKLLDNQLNNLNMKAFIQIKANFIL